MPEPTRTQSKSKIDYFNILAGLRGAVNFTTLGGLALDQGDTDSSSSSANASTTVGTTTVNPSQLLGLSVADLEKSLVIVMVVEFVFGSLMLMGLMSKYLRCGRNLTAQQQREDVSYSCLGFSLLGKRLVFDDGARYILLMRFILAVIALVTGGLLSMDLQGQSNISVAALALISISVFLVNALSEEVQETPQEEQTAQPTAASADRAALFAFALGRPGTRAEIDPEYAYTPGDMVVALRMVVKEMGGFAQGRTFRLARSRNPADRHVVFVTPPVIVDNDPSTKKDPWGFVTAGPENAVGAYFNATRVRELGSDVFDDIGEAVLNERAGRAYQIFIPFRGGMPLAGGNADERWWLLEVNIAQTLGPAPAAGGPAPVNYTVTINGHDPYAANSVVPTVMFKRIVLAMVQKMVALHVDANNISIMDNANPPAQIDLQPDAVADPPAAAVADANHQDPNVFTDTDAALEARLPVSSVAVSRIVPARVNRSALAVLHDLRLRLKNEVGDLNQPIPGNRLAMLQSHIAALVSKNTNISGILDDQRDHFLRNGLRDSDPDTRFDMS